MDNQAETATNDCSAFAEALGLQAGADDLFVGKLRGFPVGLKFIDPQGAVLLLFQVRHWLNADAPQFKSIVYEAEVAKLLTEKSLEIELEEHLAWVTFTGGTERLESSQISRVLDSVLQSFQKAGLIGDPDLCHYCQKEKVDSLSIAEGKVAQICPACLEERLKKRERDTAAPAAEAVPILLMSPGASLVGALLWAALWALFDRLVSGMVLVPRIVLAGAILCIGLLVGGPVGWIIRQNRRRGRAASASGAVFFGSLAVVAGEVFFLAWLIYKEFHVFSLSAALHVLPTYYLENDPLYLIIKIFTAVFCVVAAYTVAKPEAAKLKL